MSKISVIGWLTDRLRNKEATKPLSTSPQKYNSLDLPLGVFINAVVDGDYSKVDNFEKIYFDYCESIGGRKLVSQLETGIEMVTLERKVILGFTAIQLLCFDGMTDAEYEKVWRMVKDEYPTAHDVYSRAMTYQYITEIEPLVKSDAIDLQILKNANKSDGKQANFTRGYFAELMSAIMVALKVNINDEISTRLFCSLVCRYKDWVEIQNKHNEFN